MNMTRKERAFDMAAIIVERVTIGFDGQLVVALEGPTPVETLEWWAVGSVDAYGAQLFLGLVTPDVLFAVEFLGTSGRQWLGEARLYGQNFHAAEHGTVRVDGVGELTGVLDEDYYFTPGGLR